MKKIISLLFLAVLCSCGFSGSTRDSVSFLCQQQIDQERSSPELRDNKGRYYGKPDFVSQGCADEAERISNQVLIEYK